MQEAVVEALVIFLLQVGHIEHLVLDLFEGPGFFSMSPPMHMLVVFIMFGLKDELPAEL